METPAEQSDSSTSQGSHRKRKKPADAMESDDVTVADDMKSTFASPSKRKRSRHPSTSSAMAHLTIEQDTVQDPPAPASAEKEKERWKRHMSYKRNQQSLLVRDPLGLDPNPPPPLSNGHTKPPRNGFSGFRPFGSWRRPTGQKHRKDRLIEPPKKIDRHDPLQLNAQYQHYKATHTEDGTRVPSKSELQAERFRFGNYNRYYGYREVATDPRYPLMRPEWFEGKDCLDVGCNTGQFTLALTKAMKPRMMIGIDIDGELIRVAKRNIRHYLSEEICQREGFPKSLPILYGPIAAPAVFDPQSEGPREFPCNVAFLTCNYVPNEETDIDAETEEFDTILALSVTKWVHLNWGDDGLKMFFKRVFKHLRPGGRFILEPQAWSSYSSGRSKGKFTPTMKTGYDAITFLPESFSAYLLSDKVGFSSCETIHLPSNTAVATGFKRGIFLFTKSAAVSEINHGDK
ncbi:hypothetical protein RvY_18567 [Ramazzottius varieornatus]|uniref:RNA methyltransferase n=1 Tax=Ramazzottius varieornatus TaxID=947166 RepID=A0A1D1W686_RAMVA|nr:hypothetical protein RvY_18567 [Ramazzottius varieornatus]